MKKLLYSSILAMAAAAALWAQPSTPSGLSILGLAPAEVQGVGGVRVGNVGRADLWYWVVVRYPGGYIFPSRPERVRDTMGIGNMSVSNFVRLSWSAASASTGYDVLVTATALPPALGCTCAVVLNTSSTTVDDNGGALSAWPPGGLAAASNAVANFTVNTRDDTSPFVNVELVNNLGRTNFRLGSGGSGASTLSQLGCKVTQTTPTNRLNIFPDAAPATPCWETVGNTVQQALAPATVDITAGTGTAFIYWTTGGVVTVGHSGALTLSCSAGCTVASGITGFPDNTLPIWSWHATAGVWDTPSIDSRPFFGMTPIVCSSGLLCPVVGGVKMPQVDFTGVVGKYESAGPCGSIAGSTKGDLCTDTSASPNVSYRCDTIGGCSGGGWTIVGSSGFKYFQEETAAVTMDGTPKLLYTKDVPPIGAANCLLIHWELKFSTSGANIIVLKFGTSTFTSGVLGDATIFEFNVRACNITGSQVSQRVWQSGPMWFGSKGSSNPAFSGGGTGIADQPNTVAETWTSAVTVQVLAQSGAATTCTGKVFWLQAP